MTEPVAFVNDPEFLRSAFDFGLTLDDGVRELVDNALDAQATNIQVIIKTTKDALHLIVQDNGEGIPDMIEDEGEQFQGIPFIMSFGAGKNFMPRKKGDIGRFGVGLSATITCLTREHGWASVWSKNAGNQDGRQVTYRFSEVVENGCHLPAEQTAPSPTLSDDPIGTVVEIVLNDSAHMRPGAVQTRLLQYMGRVYRQSLAQGVEITIIAISAKGSPSAKKVHLRDPLALMPDSMEVKDLGEAKSYDIPNLVIEDIIDPETGKPAEIKFRLSFMNPISVRRTLGLPLTGSFGQSFHPDNLLKKYGIGYEGQGFNLLREGREVGANNSYGIYSKGSNYNYMHGDIDFSAALDGHFGVQANKSRISVNHNMQKMLKNHLSDFIAKVSKDFHSSSRISSNLREHALAEPIAETIAKRIKSVLPEPRLTPEERTEAEKMREDLKKALQAQVEEEMSPLVEAAQQSVNNAGTSGERDAAELELALLQERVADHIERIEQRFKTSSPTRLFFKSLHSNDLYAVEDRGDEAHITINQDTVFYSDVYSVIEKAPHLRVMVDVMINTLGYAEFLSIKHGQDDKPLFWERARAEVSLHANTFVKAMPVSSSNKGGEA